MKEVETEEIINAIVDLISQDQSLSSDDVIVKAAEIFDERGVTDEAKHIISTCMNIAKERKLIR
jgi:vacuolar-type H+-ATPase catalytic subunit A/Vma1